MSRTLLFVKTHNCGERPKKWQSLKSAESDVDGEIGAQSVNEIRVSLPEP